MFVCDIATIVYCALTCINVELVELPKFGHHNCAHGQALPALPPPFYTLPSLIVIRERNAYVTHILVIM